jgi:hypothetical protein
MSTSCSAYLPHKPALRFGDRERIERAFFWVTGEIAAEYFKEKELQDVLGS